MRQLLLADLVIDLPQVVLQYCEDWFQDRLKAGERPWHNPYVVDLLPLATVTCRRVSRVRLWVRARRRPATSSKAANATYHRWLCRFG